MNYSKFNGKLIEDVAKFREDLSYYNNNYYEDEEGNIIHASSDDDNCTDYCFVTIEGNCKYIHEVFAESFASRGDIIEVFHNFLEETSNES